MLSKRQEQANELIMEGANYWEVDDVLLEFGFPMGPFQMGDLAGIDIGWHRDPTKVTTIREALCAKERFGQKNGKGFYDYDEARNRTPSDEVKAIIADFAAKDPGSPFPIFRGLELEMAPRSQGPRQPLSNLSIQEFQVEMAPRPPST